MVSEKSETLDEVCDQACEKQTASPMTWTQIAENIIWRYLFYMVALHLGFIAALFSYASGLHSVRIKALTIFWIFVVGVVSCLGTTAGAHRLWTHRAYKANLRLRILLLIFFATMGFNSVYEWVQDHRVHHKYSETDADPHNAKRGFIFSHVGWLVMKRHPECDRRAREVNMSDIKADPVLNFQKKYTTELRLLFCFIVPTTVPVIFWKETILHAILTQCFIRYVLCVNITFSVNSVAHLWGSHPYNRLINPAENPVVSLLALGEGSHNYHHTFPWDYKASEFPYLNFNCTTLFIHAMAKLGWAYDLQAPSAEFVEKVIRRIGYKSDIKELD